MNFLEQKIINEGVLKEGDILKADGFLNHQIDIDTTRRIACEFQHRFVGNEITKILTIEASGIALASITAMQIDVPMLFAKKTRSLNVDGEVYSSDAYSFTHKTNNRIFVSSKYLLPSDKVLIVDDFLANGQALLALIDIVKQAGAEIVGCGIAIEKGFQGGGDLIRAKGCRVESIAIVDEMDCKNKTIKFKGDNTAYSLKFQTTDK